MVFSENIFSRPNVDYAGLLLTLTAPNAIDTRWLNAGQNARFGGVSGDAIGQGAFSVWQNGKGLSQGYCEFALQHVQSAVAATHGLKLISNPRRITHCQGHDLINLANQLALNTLELAWLRHANATNTPVETYLPYHQLVAVYASKASLIERNDYNISTIITGNDDHASVTLVKPMQVGDWLSWAIRDTDAAQIDLVKTASTLRRTLNAEPTFGLLFSGIGRGPSFYNGLDQDLALLKALFPKLPIIGFYGNGEIAHAQGNNVLFHNSAVLGLFC